MYHRKETSSRVDGALQVYVIVDAHNNSYDRRRQFAPHIWKKSRFSSSLLPPLLLSFYQENEKWSCTFFGNSKVSCINKSIKGYAQFLNYTLITRSIHDSWKKRQTKRRRSVYFPSTRVPFSAVHQSILAQGGCVPAGSSPASFRRSATTPWAGTLRAVKLRTAVPLSVCVHRSYAVKRISTESDWKTQDGNLPERNTAFQHESTETRSN